MNVARRRRLTFLIVMMVGVSLTVSFVLYALNKNINLYYTPTQILSQKSMPQRRIRMGGLVKKHSLQRVPNTLTIHFVVTDLTHEITAVYTGVLPALFREGQGVVVEGQLRNDGTFMAEQVLAKHDENYKPPGIGSKSK